MASPLMKTCRSNLSFIQWNIRSLNSNKINLVLLVQENQPDLIFLSETWLKPTQTMNIPGYFNIRKDRVDGYGGIAIAVRYKLLPDVVNINESFLPRGVQIIVLKINGVTFVLIYCLPHIIISTNMWSQIVSQLHKPFVILGDLNANNTLWGSNITNANGKRVQEMLDQSDLVYLNDGTPTRITSPTQNSSAVDLTICTPDVAGGSTWKVIHDPGTSDHYPIFCTLFQRGFSTQLTYPSKRKYSKANWDMYAENITEAMQRMDPYTVNYDDLNIIINEAANNAIPRSSGVIKNRKYCAAWWDGDCSTAVKERREKISIFKSNPTLDNYVMAKKTIASTQRTLKEKKKIFS